MTANMVKRSAHGTCKSDSRYPDKIFGVKFIPFPKPKSDRRKCMKWISLCRRPHSQLNVDKITKHTYICSKHFQSLDGPTIEYPDPCDAITGEIRQSRASKSKRNTSSQQTFTEQLCQNDVLTTCESEHDKLQNNSVACQTTEQIYTSLDILAYAARCKQLEEENEMLKKQLANEALKSYPRTHTASSQTDGNFVEFSAESVSKSNIKDVFTYYTGITYVRFQMLLAFLFSDSASITYDKDRKEVKRLSIDQQLFLYLCRIRNGLHMKDLAFRFNLKLQSVSTVVRAVARYFYLRLGSLSFWPHRSIIIDNMPAEYKAQFPKCVAIIDCTEIKIEKPSSLKCQSQCYSDYKSTTTLKALVVCDPRGSIVFVSDLFSGSVSDNDICVQSGFYNFLHSLMDRQFIQRGDSIMADKGFRIEKELAELGLGLNIPPMASSAHAMGAADVELTRKIAAHRIHIERAINQIKCFKIVGRKVPVSLFSYINETWFSAAMLTNFQGTLVKK